MSDINYELSPTNRELVERLWSRYPNHVGHIDLNKIVCTKKWGKRPKKSQVGEISAIKGYAKKRLEEMGEMYEYEFSVWEEVWVQLNSTIQELIIFHGLLSIPVGGGGKLKQPDVQEHGPICEYFGPYWRRERAVESLLEGDVLAIPLPPDEPVDDGYTDGFDAL